MKIDKIKEISSCIDEVALNQSKFKLDFDSIGQFPRGNKSIVWVGLKPNEMLTKLFLDLELKLEEIGIKKEEKNLTPHITIGRQVVLNEDFNKLIEIVNINNITILVNKISLMKSTRVDGKLIYTPIYVNSFK